MKKITRRILSIILALIMVFGIVPVSVFAADSGLNATNDTMLNPTQPAKEYLDSLTDPYGKGAGRPFMLNEETELFSLNNYIDAPSETYKPYFGAKVYDTFKPFDSDNKRIDDEFTSSSSYNNLPELLSFTSAVSFDPTGSGRRGCVAVVGINEAGEVRLYVCNTRAGNKSNAWSQGVTLGLMIEMRTRSTLYYQVKNFLVMTAGDYNGDGRDTLIVYGQYDRADGNDKKYNPEAYGLKEISVDVSGEQFTFTQKNDVSAGRTLLNSEYVKSNIRKDYYWDNYCGWAYLDTALATGDVNHDGVDDLCVVSYTHGAYTWASGDRPDFDHNCFVPQLSVVLGSKSFGADSVVTKVPPYSYFCTLGEETLDDTKYIENTIRSVGVTVGNVDDTPGDEIIVVGEEVQHKVQNSDRHFYDFITTEGTSGRHLAAFKFSCNGTSFSKPVIAHQQKSANLNSKINQNELLKMTAIDERGIWDCYDYSYPTISVESVYLNGKSNPACVVIGGQIYDFSEGTPYLIYNNTYLSNLKHSSFSQGSIEFNTYRSFIDSVAVGNFDGNPYGFEQVVLTIGIKTTDAADWYEFNRIVIGVKDEGRDAVTHLLPRVNSTSKIYDWQSKFYSAGDPYGNDEMDSMNDNFTYGMTSLIAAVDSDDDGTLGRYRDCKCAYADPEVLAVLQAAPYYSEMFNKNYVLSGSTTVSYSNKISDSKSSSDSSSVGFSCGLGVDVSFLGIQFFKFKNQNTYAMNWSKGFTESINYDFTRTFTAGAKDQVIVYRTPIYMYTYEVYNPDLGWGYSRDESGNPVKDNTITFNVAQSPYVEQMTIEQYNEFATKFNEDYLRPECKNSKTYASVKYFGSDLINDTDGKPFNKKMFDANKLTELDSAKSCIGIEGSPTKYKGGNGYYSLRNLTYGSGSGEENKFSMTAGGSTGQSGSISYSYSESTTSGKSVSFSIGLSEGALAIFDLGAKYDQSHSDTTSFMQGSSVSISGTVNNGSASLFNPPNRLDYEFTWKCMLWDSNIPCKKIGVNIKDNEKPKDIEYVPVIGYTVRYGDEAAKSRVLLHPNGGDCPYVVSYTNSQGLTLPIPTRSGDYTFDGWYDNPDFNGSPVTGIAPNSTGGQKEFWAKWSLHTTYKVTLNTNGGACEPLTAYKSGYETTLPIPTRDGYIFMGWYDNAECVGTPIKSIGVNETGDKEYWALWGVQYSVTLNKNGGTCQDLTSYCSGVGATLPVPTKDGFEFAGWYNNPDFNGNKITAIGKNETGNKEFWAKWIPVYTISLHYNGSEADRTITYTHGRRTELPVPTWDKKHTFDGWYDNPEFNGESVKYIDENASGNKEYWAKWTVFTHVHDGIDFDTPWDSNELPTQGGNYCLTRDIFVDKTAYINENVSICLNGHTMTVNAPITVEDRGRLNIYDCSDAVTAGYIDSNEHVWKPGSGDGESCNLKGGIITSSVTDMKSLFHVYGELNLLGGNIAGVYCTGTSITDYQSGVIYVDKNAVLGLYGANIIGNYMDGYSTAGQYYGIIFADVDASIYMTDGKISYNGSKSWYGGCLSLYHAKFNMTGGEISNNKSNGYGGGVYAEYCNVTFGGNAKIIDNIGNSSSGEPSNFYIWGDIPFRFADGDKAPQSGMKINVSYSSSPNYVKISDYCPYDYSANFGADDERYSVVYGSDGCLYLVYNKYTRYNVTLHTNGGTCKALTSYTYGVGATLPTPTKDGFAFAGWYDNADFSGDRIISIGPNETGAKEFWAKWTVNTYNVTLHANGGSCDDLTSYTYGVGATLPVPTKDGFTFAGWYDNADFNGNSITAIGANETGNKEFWAKWTVNTYNVTLHANGGACDDLTSYTYGVGATLPVPTKDGFDFAGWYDNPDFNGDSITAIGANETGNKEFWAKWNIVTDDGAPEIIVVGNDIVLLQHKYPVDKLSLAYIGPVYKEINDWNSFETAGLLYKDINGSIGYKQYPHPADGKTITENNTGYYAAFIRYYVDGVRVLKYQVVYLDADEHLVHFDADNDHFCDLCGTQISSHKGVLQNGVEPTLFSAGYKSYYLCSCDTCFEDEECLISIRDLAQWKSAGGRGYLPMLTAPENNSSNGSGNNLNEQAAETPEQVVEQSTEQTPVTTTEPTTEPTTEKEAEQTSAGVGTLRSNGTVWIIVGVVAAAILGVVLYIIIRKKKKA